LLPAIATVEVRPSICKGAVIDPSTSTSAGRKISSCGKSDVTARQHATGDGGSLETGLDDQAHGESPCVFAQHPGFHREIDSLRPFIRVVRGVLNDRSVLFGASGLH
jgi:hypothetical protein